MTREEAIHYAECLKNNWTINFNDMEDFCNMAIRSLESGNEFENDCGKMTREEAVKKLEAICFFEERMQDALNVAVNGLKEIIALGKDLRTFRDGITDKNTLIGFNMAVAICNKHLGEKI